GGDGRRRPRRARARRRAAAGRGRDGPPHAADRRRDGGHSPAPRPSEPVPDRPDGRPRPRAAPGRRRGRRRRRPAEGRARADPPRPPHVFSRSLTDLLALAANRSPKILDELRSPVAERERKRLVVEHDDPGISKRRCAEAIDDAVADNHATVGSELDAMTYETRNALGNGSCAGGSRELLDRVLHSVDQPEAIAAKMLQHSWLIS